MGKRVEQVDSQFNTSGKSYAACKRHALYYASVLSKANQFYLNGGDAINEGFALLDQEWPNLETGQAWAASLAEGDNLAAELSSIYAEDGVNLFLLRRHPQDLIRWLEAALIAARHLRKRSYEGMYLSNLGLAYSQLNRPRQAIEFYEQSLYERIEHPYAERARRKLAEWRGQQ